jgi:hypothetical protein
MATEEEYEEIHRYLKVNLTYSTFYEWCRKRKLLKAKQLPSVKDCKKMNKDRMQ